jgi:hypothetical protein
MLDRLSYLLFIIEEILMFHRCRYTMITLITLISLASICLSSVLAFAQTGKTSTRDLPPPPEIIAPDNLIPPEEFTLSPEQSSKREGEYKSSADQAYSRGDYKETLVALQRAYLISKNPRYIANQGLVLEKLGRYQEAIQALEYFLLTNPPPDKARAAQQVISKLRPEVKFITDPPNAQIFLDGQLVTKGMTPLIIRVTAGKHPLELKLKGYETLKTTLFVLPGKPMLAQYKLYLGSESFVEAKPTAQPNFFLSLPPMTSAQVSGVTFGATSLGVSLLSFLLSRGAVIERDSARTRVDWSTAHREAETFNRLSYSSAGVGLTILLGGLTWWMLSPDPSSTSSSSSTRPESSAQASTPPTSPEPSLMMPSSAASLFTF